MKNLDSKRFALAIFAVFAVFFCGLVYRSDKNVLDLQSTLKIAYETIPLILTVVGVFVSYAWRWKIFRGWLVPFPDLNGTWQGSVETTWKSPNTGEVTASIPVILAIKQSFIRISCVMRSAEMTSRSYLADFWLDVDEQVRMLGSSYHSKPLPSVTDRSQPHDGTIVFELVGNPVEKLIGTYWTDRKTTGQIVLKFREKKRLEEFPNVPSRNPMSGKE